MAPIESAHRTLAERELLLMTERPADAALEVHADASPEGRARALTVFRRAALQA